MIRLHEASYDIVQTQRIDAGETGWLKALTARAFYALLNRVGELNVAEGAAYFRLISRDVLLGSDTARLFERILEDKPHPEMGYRACLGIIRLADVCKPARMESPAQLALATGACRCQSIKSILKNSLDLAPTPKVETPPATTTPPHDNIRGAGYFDGRCDRPCSNNR